MEHGMRLRPGEDDDEIDDRLKEALKRLNNRFPENRRDLLYIEEVRFNRATVNHPIANQLALDECHFADSESLELFKDFIATNREYPLKFFSLRKMQDGPVHDVYGNIVSSLRTNNTVEELHIDNIHDPNNMTMMNALLQENHNMTKLALLNDSHHPDVPFLGSIRAGLVASRGRLQELAFISGMRGDDGLNGNAGLQELLAIYITNHDDVDDGSNIYDVNNTALTELHLLHSNHGIRGFIGGDLLRRLLGAMPRLTTLNVLNARLGPDGARGLFQAPTDDGPPTARTAAPPVLTRFPARTAAPPAFLSRLQTLSLDGCHIRNEGLEHMASAVVPHDSPLEFLDLSNNGIKGRSGTESLARLLSRCNQLETLRLTDNGRFKCDVLFASLASRPHLNELCLKNTGLQASILVALVQFLASPTGRCMEELGLSYNKDLFRATNNVPLADTAFFDEISNHQHMRFLYVRGSEMGDSTNKAFTSCMLKNATLVRACSSDIIINACLRRNRLLRDSTKTMENPCTVPWAAWPMALAVGSPRPRHVCFSRQNNYDERQEEKMTMIPVIAPTLVYRLLVKMLGVEGLFVHTAQVYRFRKVRATVRVQRFWRRRRASIHLEQCLRHRTNPVAEFLHSRMRQDEIDSLLDETAGAKIVRDSLLVETASLSDENADLRSQAELLAARLRRTRMRDEMDSLLIKKASLSNENADLRSRVALLTVQLAEVAAAGHQATRPQQPQE
jgi:hypothetical protein